MPKFNYRTQKLIDEFSKKLDAIEKHWPMTSNYERYDPYIVPYVQCKQVFEFIIYHRESKEWFDCAVTDTILTMITGANLISDSEIIFDLGCNAGAMTVPMAALCARGGMVHSFDPYPWNALATSFNAQLNGLSNVVTYPVGLSNRDYTISVGKNDTRAFITDETENAHEITIHNFSRYKNLNPTFLKIDIEGSEHDLFSGGDHDHEKFKSVKAFALEFHPFWIRPRGIDPKLSLKGMQDSGFDLSYYHPNGAPFDVDTYHDDQHLFWGKATEKA